MNKYAKLFLVFLTTTLTSQGGAFKDGVHVGPIVTGDLDEDDIVFGWQGVYEFDEMISVEMTISGQEGSLDPAEVILRTAARTLATRNSSWSGSS